MFWTRPLGERKMCEHKKKIFQEKLLDVFSNYTVRTLSVTQWRLMTETYSKPVCYTLAKRLFKKAPSTRLIYVIVRIGFSFCSQGVRTRAHRVPGETKENQSDGGWPGPTRARAGQREQGDSHQRGVGGVQRRRFAAAGGRSERRGQAQHYRHEIRLGHSCRDEEPGGKHDCLSLYSSNSWIPGLWDCSGCL